jgi:uncharacterized protein with PIN domain
MEKRIILQGFSNRPSNDSQNHAFKVHSSNVLDCMLVDCISSNVILSEIANAAAAELAVESEHESYPAMVARCKPCRRHSWSMTGYHAMVVTTDVSYAAASSDSIHRRYA